MKKFFFYPIAFVSAILLSCYVVVLLALFLIHSLAVLFILPARMIDGDYRWDYNVIGEPRKRSVLQWIACIYQYEMRGDLVWEAIYDEILRDARY